MDRVDRRWIGGGRIGDRLTHIKQRQRNRELEDRSAVRLPQRRLLHSGWDDRCLYSRGADWLAMWDSGVGRSLDTAGTVDWKYLVNLEVVRDSARQDMPFRHRHHCSGQCDGYYDCERENVNNGASLPYKRVRCCAMSKHVMQSSGFGRVSYCVPLHLRPPLAFMTACHVIAVAV